MSLADNPIHSHNMPTTKPKNRQNNIMPAAIGHAFKWMYIGTDLGNPKIEIWKNRISRKKIYIMSQKWYEWEWKCGDSYEPFDMEDTDVIDDVYSSRQPRMVSVYMRGKVVGIIDPTENQILVDGKKYHIRKTIIS